MNQPQKCINCLQPLEIKYDMPFFIRNPSPGMGGGSYGGPLSVPQCANCGADAYMDSRGWHIRKRRTTHFTIVRTTNA